MHFSTSRKVAGSISDGVIRIFHRHLVGRAVALGVDPASNRNEYQEYFLGGKGGRCVGLTTLPPSRADCLKIWEPKSLGTLRACGEIAFAFYTRKIQVDRHIHGQYVPRPTADNIERY